MDEVLLNDLLECSVCLDRLDTSSRVLPCQHTFCIKCLKEILQSHKELRCPECRVLVEIRLEELPPNVLLMRILEGMRSSRTQTSQQAHLLTPTPAPVLTPTPAATPQHHPNPQHHANPTPQHQSIPNPQRQLNPSLTPQHQPGSANPAPQPQPAPQHQPGSANPTPQHQPQCRAPHARAVYDYLSKEPGDLSFKKGDAILLKKRIDTHWYYGECGGKQGAFPMTYAKVVVPLPVSGSPQCKALYDFHMAPPDEEGCLSFQKGAMIGVIRRVDENWAEGRLNERIGIFPIAFVDMNAPARALMKLSSSLRCAPILPTAETTLLGGYGQRTDQINNVYHQQQTAQTAPDLIQLVTSNYPSDSSSSTTTPGGSSSTPDTSSESSSPASPPPSDTSRNMHNTYQSSRQLAQLGADVSPRHSRDGLARGHTTHHRSDTKRHSLTTTPQQMPQATAQNRHSAEILTSVEPEVQDLLRLGEGEGRQGTRRGGQLPAAYVALYPYKPQKADELELKKGGVYMVLERCQDGWYKGCSTRTNKCGVFPGNYVAVAARPPAPPGPGPAAPPAVAGPSQRVPDGPAPPDLPPRAASPVANTSPMFPWSSTPKAVSAAKSSEKVKDKSKSDKMPSSMSLMKRLAAMKRSKSPPSAPVCQHNPVFSDSPPPHPVHVRSGSCPSQLLHEVGSGGTVGPARGLRQNPGGRHTLGAGPRARPRPSIAALAQIDRSNEVVWTPRPPQHHRKSQSLDATTNQQLRKDPLLTGQQLRSKDSVLTRERFRCIVAYPPNSEYELELRVDDTVLVHRKWGDGWYKGTLERTGRTGLFPASFVEPAPPLLH